MSKTTNQSSWVLSHDLYWENKMYKRKRSIVFLYTLFSHLLSEWKKCYMKCGVWNQLKIWSSHLLDNLSNCLMNLKNSGDSTGFESMTSAMPFKSRWVESRWVTWIFQVHETCLNCPASAKIISSVVVRMLQNLFNCDLKWFLSSLASFSIFGTGSREMLH